MRTLMNAGGGGTGFCPTHPVPSVAGVSHHLVQTPRLRMHLAEAGQGPPLLLVHGWLQHWYAWRHVLPSLAGHHRVLAPDLRGFGWTEATARGYTTSEMVDDLIALLDTLDVERVFVLGHELGGRLAFHLSLRYPERVYALVTVNSLHPYWRAGRVAQQAWRQWWTPFVETPVVGRTVLRRLPAFARTLFRCGYPGGTGLERAAVDEYLEVLRKPGYARAAERVQSNFAYRELIPTLLGRYRSSRLAVPTLMLNGTKDFALASSALGGYERYADDLNVDLVPGGGHFLPEQQPELVATKALTFFRLHASFEPARKVGG